MADYRLEMLIGTQEVEPPEVDYLEIQEIKETNIFLEIFLRSIGPAIMIASFLFMVVSL